MDVKIISVTVVVIIALIIVLVLVNQGSPSQTSSVPSAMDYYAVYAFNCEASDMYPLKTEEVVITITEQLNRGMLSRKSPYLNCNLVGDYILWDPITDECIKGYDSLLRNRALEVQSVTVTGYSTGETPEGLDEYEMFHLIDVPDRQYVCCNICCNEESPFFSESKKCFWYKQGDEKAFPYPKMLE